MKLTKMVATNLSFCAYIALTSCGPSASQPWEGDPVPPPDSSDVFVGTNSLMLNSSGEASSATGARIAGSDGTFLIGGEIYQSVVSLEHIFLLDVQDENRLIFDAASLASLPVAGTVNYQGTGYLVFTAGEIGEASGTYSGQMDFNANINFANSGASFEFTNFQNGLFASLTNNGNFDAYESSGHETILVSDTFIDGNSIVDENQTELLIEHFGQVGSNLSVSGESIDVIAAFAGDDASEIGGVIGFSDPLVIGEIVLIGAN